MWRWSDFVSYDSRICRMRQYLGKTFFDSMEFVKLIWPKNWCLTHVLEKRNSQCKRSKSKQTDVCWSYQVCLLSHGNHSNVFLPRTNSNLSSAKVFILMSIFEATCCSNVVATIFNFGKGARSDESCIATVPWRSAQPQATIKHETLYTSGFLSYDFSQLKPKKKINIYFFFKNSRNFSEKLKEIFLKTHKSGNFQKLFCHFHLFATKISIPN